MIRAIFTAFLISFGSVVFGQDSLVIDSSELDQFASDLIQEQLHENIPGAVLVVVHNGKLIYSKGFGYSNVENQVEVDPDTHLFRIGSISKLFVWTSLMQLIQTGKVSLEDDVAQIVDLQIPNNYDQAIKVKHLFTHTQGFEDRIIGLFGRDEDSMRPVAEILVEQMPDQVSPPGKFSSYSNHGTGIAQYIVETISGQSFHDYVRENIFRPLKMNKTTFQQPVEASLSADVAIGYALVDGEYLAAGFEYVPLYGVGGGSATAVDMANFMIAHLQLGVFDEQQILDSATAQLMQSPASYNHPKVNPMRYGFMDVSQNGKTIIGHGGDTGLFHSFLALFPEEDLGFFISYNGQNGGPAYFDFVSQFVDHYFPESLEKIQPAFDLKAEGEKYEGFYSSNRYPHSTLAKMAKLAISGGVEINDEGYLQTNFLGNQQEWFPLDEEVFRNRNSSEILVFNPKQDGKGFNLFIGNLPIFVFEQATGLDNPLIHLIILITLLLVSLFTVIFWILKYFVRRKKRYGDTYVGRLPYSSKRVGFLISMFWLLFFVLFAIGLMIDPFALAFEVPFLLQFALIFPTLIVFLLVLMAYQLILILKNPKIFLYNKLFYLLLFFVYLDGIWLLNYWNLLGFKY